ncbi:MarR family transcriptional regulator [Sphingomonas populi]|uniref:MarR family transcriptional regulator n=1 Tax=Sphingomonas populi TaxID=2484750 RepID=A0A4Q6XLV6_9SPHN|nr:MarR family winged helix-turn-helix transcriptional regulator [Sphingomonas populi]RZF61120.1 MarR family transcriptional regulator [Sphingomonas populi]
MANLQEERPDDGVELGVLTDLAGYHLRRASAAFAADFARVLEGTGMRQVLFGVLSVVAANPDINQGMVGRSLGIQRANMVALINELVELNLVEREVAKDDRRAFALRLSPIGQDILAECIQRIRAHEEEMLSDLAHDERGRLIRLLMRIEAKERS